MLLIIMIIMVIVIMFISISISITIINSIITLIRGNHLSNTTCLTQVFFKSDE